jgi:hypothetical protein
MIIAPDDEPNDEKIVDAISEAVKDHSGDDPQLADAGEATEAAAESASLQETEEIHDIEEDDLEEDVASIAEAPRRAPHSRPIPETDGYLKIVLPLPAPPRDPDARSAGVRALFTSRRGIILISVLALVVLLLGVASYAATDYYAPAVVANDFCSDLQSRDFGSAYRKLSSDLQGQISREGFQQIGQALDEGEGPITGCDVNFAPGSYGRALGSTSATAQTGIRRALAGRQSGPLTLIREDGAWRINGIGSSALGGDLAALGVLSAYCSALRDHEYLAAYTLLGHDLQNEVSYGEFVVLTRAAEEIDGAIQSCGLAGARDGQANGVAMLTAVVRRGGSGVSRGAIVLHKSAGHWEIAGIAATALGSDLGPLQIGARFCSDLVTGALDDAYALLSDRFQSQITRTQFNDDLLPDAGARWTACAPVLRTYHVDGDQAMVDVQLTATFGDGATNVAVARLLFTRVDSRWYLDGVRF